MKSTREPFDNELRERLLNYTEGLDKDLWKGIAPNIVSVNPAPRWVIWSNRLSVAVIVLSVILLFTTDEDGLSEKTSLNQITSNAEAIGGSGTPAPYRPGDISVTKKSRSNESEISTSGLAPTANEPNQLTRLTSEVRAEEGNSSRVFKNETTGVTTDGVGVISGLAPSDTTTSTQSKGNKLLMTRDLTEKKRPSHSEKNELNQKPFTLYFTAMPTFGYQRIESNNNDNILIESIKHVPAFSIDRLGVRIEAGAEVRISRRWKAFGGVLYYQRKQTIEYTEKQVDSLITGSGPGGELTIETQFDYVRKSIEYELKNVGLQAGVTYQLWMRKQNAITAKAGLYSKTRPLTKTKFLHVVGTGIEFHRAINRTSAFESAEGFSDPSMYVFFNLYYRLQYPNVGRLRAIFQPTLNYSFYINEDLNAPFYVKPYGLGLNFGCTYNFR